MPDFIKRGDHSNIVVHQLDEGGRNNVLRDDDAGLNAAGDLRNLLFGQLMQLLVYRFNFFFEVL